MSYDYEALLDEHFQMLCQSLLVLEYPQTQCFPVGMPDGGRDALSSDGSDVVVFQVKYARDFRSIADPVKWIESAVIGEKAKVERLKDRGATRYVLVTNMPGTSHLDGGRIDRVQKIMDEHLPLPSFCMWREDLDRRLDPNFDLKLRYPGLLNGPDVVRVLWQQVAASDPGRSRRAKAMDAYLASQYHADATVRFKQAELVPSPLMDLYVDVPVDFPSDNIRSGKNLRLAYAAAARRALQTTSEPSEDLRGRFRTS